MTPEQYRLYNGILRLFRIYGTGGATWTRTRGTGGTPVAAPAFEQTASVAVRFCQNNRVAPAGSLPAIPIFTAPWWGLADAAIDIQPGDIYDNGVIAYLVTGAPDTSQGFLVVPAAECGLPLQQAHIGAGYQAGLRIGLQTGLN